MPYNRLTLVEWVHFDSWPKEVIFGDKLNKKKKYRKADQVEQVDSKGNYAKGKFGSGRFLKDH